VLGKIIVGKRQKRLLIIEDLEGTRDSFRMFLDDYFEINDFGSSEETLACFRTLHPDVVLLDIGIAGSVLQGPDLLKIMKEESKETVICMVSAYSHLEKQMLDLGADGFIKKPCGRGELFDFLIAKGLMKPIVH